MRQVWSVSRAPLAALVLLAVAVNLASSAASAPRPRLRCTVAPRLLPAGGGEIRIQADAGALPLDAVIATIIRPDRTPVTVELAPLETGGFEGSYEVPENPGRGVQRYSVRVAARGEAAAGLTANCGVVRVKSSAETPPLVISSCEASPRRLPSDGGVVAVEARVVGRKPGLSVKAVITGPGVDLEAPLVIRRGAYRGSFELPANTGGSAQTFAVQLVAQHEGASPVEAECGIVTTAPDGSAGGIAVVGSERNRPFVRTFRADTLDPLDTFLGFDAEFQGSATVAVGDVTGDGQVDFILGAGPGAAPMVQVVRGGVLEDLGSFLAYGPSFTGGIHVAAGDVNGDGRADIITGASPGATGGHVKVFDGASGALLSSFLTFDAGYRGGVNVAAGDVNGDGRDDIIVGTSATGAPHVKVFSGRDSTLLRSIRPDGASFSGGVYVAAGDVNGDGRADIITGAGATGGPHVKVFDGRTNAQVHSFFAYESSFTGGVRVAVGDVNGDGRADIITGAGPGAAGGHVKVFDGVTGAQTQSFLPFDPGFTGGVSVAAWR